MRVTIFALLLFPLIGFSQSQVEARPTYCDGLPVTYEKVAFQKAKSSRPALPQFATAPTIEYKVQVAILRATDPKNFSFHSKLVARYRTCEEVWVVESKESFADKNEARKLQTEMEKLGYRGAFITELVAYNGGK